MESRKGLPERPALGEPDPSADAVMIDAWHAYLAGKREQARRRAEDSEAWPWGAPDVSDMGHW